MMEEESLRICLAGGIGEISLFPIGFPLSKRAAGLGVLVEPGVASILGVRALEKSDDCVSRRLHYA